MTDDRPLEGNGTSPHERRIPRHAEFNDGRELAKRIIEEQHVDLGGINKQELTALQQDRTITFSERAEQSATLLREADEIRTIIYDLISLRMIDRSMTKHIPTAALLGELQQKYDLTDAQHAEILANYSTDSRRSPAYTFSAGMIEWQERMGYEVIADIDAGDLYGANFIREVGDIMLRDIINGVLGQLGDDAVSARPGGDEFRILQRVKQIRDVGPDGVISYEDLPVTPIDVSNIEHAAEGKKSLFLVGKLRADETPIYTDPETGNYLVWRDIVINRTTASPQPPVPERRASLTKREETLTTLHPELEHVLHKLAYLSTIEKDVMVSMFESIFFDPFLVSLVEGKKQQFKSLEFFRDTLDFIEHLQEDERHTTHGTTFLRVEIPGVVKRINTNKKLGYEAGTALIIDTADDMLTIAQEVGIEYVKGTRSGADFLLALPNLPEYMEINPETGKTKLELLQEKIYERLRKQHTTTDTDGKDHTFTILPVVVSTTEHFTHVSNHSLTVNDENIERFFTVRNRLAQKSWHEIIQQISTFMETDEVETAVGREFVANYFNPFDKRGLLHLKKLPYYAHMSILNRTEEIEVLEAMYEKTGEDADSKAIYALKETFYDSFYTYIQEKLSSGIPLVTAY